MLLHSRAAALMTKRSSARVAVSSSMVMNNMKSTTRKYSHSSKAIATNNCYTASDNNSNNNGSVFSISMTTSRTMSSKPCFAWEEKRVEVTNAEELQRRLNRIKVHMLLLLFFDAHTLDQIRVLIRANLSHQLTLCVIPSLYSVILFSHHHDI